MAGKVKVGGETFLIENSYPIPEAVGGTGGVYTPIRLLLRQLEVGDSVLIPVSREGSVKNAMTKEKVNNKHFVLRTMKPEKRNFRIWRTE